MTPPSVRLILAWGHAAHAGGHGLILAWGHAARAGGHGLATIECTPLRFVLRAGTATLVLDKAAGTACLQRKGLLWDRKPVTIALEDISAVAVAPAFERSCGIASSHLLLATRSRTELELPILGKVEAEEAAEQLKDFLQLERNPS